MPKKSKKNLSLGSWAFLIGVFLAIIFGIIGMNENIAIILIILGIAIGLLNISEKEVMPFLMSGTVLIIASSFGQVAISSTLIYAVQILNALLLIFVPATIIVAIKNVFSLAKH